MSGICKQWVRGDELGVEFVDGRVYRITRDQIRALEQQVGRNRARSDLTSQIAQELGLEDAKVTLDFDVAGNPTVLSILWM